MSYRRPILMLLLLTVALAACSIRLSWPQREVELGLTGEASDEVHLTTGGVEMVLTSGSLAVRSVDLIECEDGLAFGLVSEAWAHGTDTPTRIAQGFAADVVRDADVSVGVLLPPDGHFCEVEVLIAPIEEDSRSPGTAVVDSLAMEGRFQDVDGSWRAFSVADTAKVTARASVDLFVGGEEPLDVQLRFDLSRWFEGIEPADLAARNESASRRLLANVRGSLEAL